MNKPKLRSSVSVVKLDNNVIEFFLTNTRRQVKIRIQNESLLEIILSLDGNKTKEEICNINNIDKNAKEAFNNLLRFLEQKSIIKDAEKEIDIKEYKKFRRIITFLEDYAGSYEDKEFMWNNIKNSHVVVIGLGAVGTWVATQLIQSGVRNITIMDADCVDISNLHRQFGFKENDVERLKVDVVEENLKKMNSLVNVKKIADNLTADNLEEYLDYDVDLIINCADNPSVDVTSMWVGEYAMKKKIPHIIGGGYNLHISLLGQTIIPFETACVKCFEKGLNKLNTIDVSNIKKLNIKNRKIGSFGPMCSIIASMTTMEAIKVLSKKIAPSNINRRGEFSIYNMDINYHYVEKDENCTWCGNGIV